MVEMPSVETAPKMVAQDKAAEEPHLHTEFGAISPDDVGIYGRVTGRLRQQPDAEGVSILILSKGERSFEGKDLTIPEGKLGLIFQENKPGAIDARFFGALSRALQLEKDVESRRFAKIDELAKAKSAHPEGNKPKRMAA